MAEEKKKRKGERTDGRIQARVNVGRDEKGKIKYKYFYGKTQKEAKEKADKYKSEIITYGKAIEKTDTTLSEWTYKHLFNNVLSTVAGSTFERTISIYNNYLKDTDLGNMNIQDVEPINIQGYLNSHISLSKSSLKKIYNLLNGSFKAAVSNGLIRINPIASVKLPNSELKTKEVEILTLEEQKAYMNELERHSNGVVFLTALYTGMRIGELLALRWENVDLKNKTIKVCESSKRVKIYNNKGIGETQTVTKTPKTDKGNRIIPISDSLVSILDNITSEKEGLVFRSRTGNQLQHSMVWDTHCRICKNANIRHVGIHALRHTFASRCIEKGVDIKTVSDLLGHADVTTTLNIYVHSNDDTKRAATVAIDNLYTEILKKPSPN